MELLVAVLATLALISILGVIIAFSPTLVLTELTILTRSKNAAYQSIAFIAGIACAIILFCLIAVVFIDPSTHFTIPSTRDVIRSIPVTDIIVGVLLILVSVRISRPKPPHAKTKPSRLKPEKLLNTKTLFWFGFIKMATSLSSIAAIILAARFIMTSVGTGTLQFMSVLWLIAVAVFPFILILLLKQYRPAAFIRIQAASDRAVELNWRRVAAFVLVVLGFYFLANGLTHIK